MSNRNTSPTCEKCDQPRYMDSKGRRSKFCLEHQREDWRIRQQNKNRQPTPRITHTAPAGVCRMCGCTPAEATFAALHHDSWCYYCTWIDTPRDELLRRLNPAPAPEPASTPVEKRALLIDPQTNALQVIVIRVVHAEPLPTDSRLRVRLLDAEKAGTLVLRRHKITRRDSIADEDDAAAMRSFDYYPDGSIVGEE